MTSFLAQLHIKAARVTLFPYHITASCLPKNLIGASYDFSFQVSRKNRHPVGCFCRLLSLSLITTKSTRKKFDEFKGPNVLRYVSGRAESLLQNQKVRCAIYRKSVERWICPDISHGSMRPCPGGFDKTAVHVHLPIYR